jgi:hypothetical protein
MAVGSALEKRRTLADRHWCARAFYGDEVGNS